MKINQKTMKLTTMGILTALIILMSFTPIGYLKVGIIEITFLMIPVIIGGIIEGPLGGLYCGTIFGITSFIQCFGLSAFGSMMMTISPFLAFVTCVPTRMLTGLLVGLIFKAINKKSEKDTVPVLITCLVGPLINTILFTSCVFLFFRNAEMLQSINNGNNIILFIGAFAGINGLIECLVAFLIGSAIGKALLILIKKMH